MNPSTYVKNVGKSFGYIGYDIFSSFNPNLASMMTETKDLAKDIKESARTMYGTAGQKLNEMDLKNSAKNYGKNTWSNFKSDLKSGNFYNKGRKDAASDAAMKAMFDGDDFDFNEDFNFDDDDYGDGTKESELDMSETLVETSKSQISAAAANANFLAETINASQEHSAKKIIAGNIASTEYLASIQRQTAGTICSVVERSSASIVNQLANIGMGVTAIAQLSQPMAVHFQNASTYYTKSTELQQRMVESLEKLVENTTPVDTRFKSKNKHVTIDDIVGLSGFSPKAYADMLKQNAEEMKESITPMLEMFKMFSGGSSFKDSPISSLMTMGLNFMMPKSTKKSMESFNDTLPAFFRSLLGGMEDKDFGLIGNMLKDFLLPKNRFLDKLDPSNYNKGKADWTGKDSKALTEVIPYQLSLLVSAITGEDQKIFDYNSGKWKRVAAVKTEWNNMKLKEGFRAGGDYRTLINDALGGLSSGGGISEEQRQMMQKEIDSYFQSTVAERGDRFRDINKDDFDHTKSGMSKETWEFMRQINKSIGEQNNLFTKFVGDVYSARNTYGKKIREMSESGESVFNALFNNSLFDDEDEKEILKAKKKSDKLKGIKDEPNISVNLGTDKYGYNIWFYLQGLYQHTKHISDNLGNIGSGGGKRRKGSGSISPIEDLMPKREKAEQITQQREQRAGAQTVSRVSDSAINSAVQEVLNHSRAGGDLIKLSQKAQEYKIMRDSAIATGQPYVKDERLEKEIEEVEAKNEEIQKAYDKVAGGAVVTTVKEFQSSLANIIGAPTRMISRYLDAATVSMNRMLFGDNGTGAKGLGETIHDDLNSDFLKPLRDQMEKIFGPFKAIGSGLARMLFGTKDEDGNYQGKLLSNFANKTRGVFRDIKDSAAGIFYKDLDQVRKARQMRRDYGTGADYANHLMNMGLIGDDEDDMPKALTPEEIKKRSEEGSKNSSSEELSEQEELMKLAGMFDTAARGRKVTKTGVVAVSEGELIIPSEMNPYYHKKTNKSQQVRNETKAARRFFGLFDDGGTVTDDGKGETKPESISSKVIEGARNLRDSAKEKIDQNMEEKGVLYQTYEAGQKAKDYILSRVKKAMDKTVGTDKDLDKLKDNLLQVKDSIFGDKDTTTDKLAGGAAGALIGGGAGLLLGGPILGAALGGAAGIIMKSKETQKVLFGNEETGEKGVLPKKVADFMQKNIPSMAKGGGIGAGIGLFMGSPVMGALLGSAVGYVKSSDKAKNLIFGEMKDGERQGGIIPKEIQQGIKKAYPNIAVGALGGALFGPLGIAGNIIMGSAIGYASSTDKFKKWLFGEEGEGGTPVGGFVKLVKENVANPLVDIFTGIGENIKNNIRSTFHNVGKEIRQIVFRQFKSALSPFARIGKGLLGKGSKLLEGIIGNDKFSVGTLLKGAARRTQNKALKKGNRIWDRENKQWLGAEGRQQWADERGIDRGIYGMIDDAMLGKNEALGQMTTEKARRLNKDLRSLYDSGKSIDQDYRKSQVDAFGVTADLRTNLNSRNDIDRDKLKESNNILSSIERDIKKGKFDRAFKSMAELEKLGIIDQKDFDNLMSKLNSAKEKHDLKKDYADRGNGALEDVLAEVYGKEMAAKMVKMKDSDIAKVLDNLKVDIKSMDLKTDAALSEEEAIKEKEVLMQEAVVEKIPNAIYDLIATVRQKYEGNKASEATNSSGNEANTDSNAPEIKEEAVEEIGDGTKESIEPQNGDTKTDSEGNKFIFTNGEWRVDNTDSETRNRVSKRDQIYEYLKQLPIIGGAVTGFGTIFGAMKDGLLGDGKKGKKGLLTTIKEKLFGSNDESDEGGVLNNFFNFFKKPDFKGGFKEFLSGAGDLALPVVWGLALSKAFDNQFNKIVGGLSIIKGNDTKNGFGGESIVSANTGKSVAVDENGEIIKDENGNIQMTDGTYENTSLKNIGTDNRLSTQLKTNIATGILTSNSSLATSMIGKVATSGKKMINGVSRMVGRGEVFAETTTKLTGEHGLAAVGKVTDKLAMGIIDKIDDVFIQLPNIIAKLPWIGKYADVVAEFLKPLREKIMEKLLSLGAGLQGIAAKIAAAAPFIKVAYLAGVAINAWGNAESILGITQKASTGQKVIATLLAVVNAAIPFVGNLIPNKTLVNIFMTIAPKVGIDVSDLAEQRSEAEAEVEAYNAENGTDLSIEEYNQMNGRAGIFTKAKNGIKSAFANLKEKGVEGVLESAGNKIKEAASSVNEFLGISDIFELAKKGDIKGVLTYNAKDEDDSGLVGIAKNGIGMIVKKIALPVAVFSAAGQGIKKTFDAITKWGSDVGGFITDEINFGKTIMEGKSENGFRDFFTIPDPPEGPFQEPLKILGFSMRAVQFPISIVKRMGAEVGKFFGNFASGVKQEVTTYASAGVDIFNSVKAGSVSQLWQSSEYDGAGAEGGFLNGVFKAAQIVPKVFLTVPTLLVGAGKKVGEFFGSTVEKIRNHYANCDARNAQLAEIAKKGNLSELMAYEYEDDGENPLGWVFKHTNTLSKWMYIPSTLMHKAGNAIGDLFNNVSNDIHTDWDSVQTSQDKMKKAAQDGKILEVLGEKFEKSKYNPLGGIHGAIFNVSKIFYGLYAGAEKVFGIVGDIFDSVVGKAKDKLGEWGILDSDTVDENGNTVTKEGLVTKVGNGVSDLKQGAVNLYNGAKENFMNWGDSVIDWVNGGSGSAAAAGSGFVSQMDPRYAGQKLGKSTVAEMGCGPAVAAMALNMRAKGSNMDEAINVARGYQTPQGTDASYFGDYYRSKGVEAKYYSEPYDIYNSIAAGTPTVLMGRDGSNTSKRRSPFGPNNHYVVASGFDKNGRVIINDPEMRKPRSYSADILNHVGMAVGMGSGLNRRGRFGIAAGGGPLRVDKITQAVWGFLINNGFSEAAVAGIMGNMDAESGINPEAIQPNGDKAYGICQWAGERKNNLIRYASNKGCQWTDLATQLEFLLEELQSGGQYLGSKAEKYKSLSEFMNATDPAQAAVDFEKSFERAGKPVLEKRIEAALYYYNQFTGKTFDSPRATQGSTGGISTGAAVATAAATVGSAISEGGSILDKIKSAFTTGFGMSAIFGGLSSSSSGSETSGTGDVNYNGTPISENPAGPNLAPGSTPVDYLKSVAGRVDYSMSGPRNPELGSADCSSTVQWAVKKATGKDIGGSTPAQYNDDDLNTVWYDGGKVAQSLPSNIQPNDILFFSRPNSAFTAGRADRVGHVEVYEGNGMMIGHGSGMGPKEKEVPIGEGKNGGLIKVMRLKPEMSSVGAYAKTTGLNIRTAEMEMRQSAAGSGLMDYVDAHRDQLEAYSRKNISGYSKYASRTRIPRGRSIDKSAKAFIGAGAAGINDQSGVTAVKSMAVGDDKKSIALLVKSLIPLVEAIVKNTNSIDGIYKLVAQLVQQGGGTSEEAGKAFAMISESMQANKEIDSDLQGLKDTVNRILAG